jgi:hypothetical protein
MWAIVPNSVKLAVQIIDPYLGPKDGHYSIFTVGNIANMSDAHTSVDYRFHTYLGSWIWPTIITIKLDTPSRFILG